MTTMLDKVAVAGDATKALDRTGVWTVALTVIGGTSGTAVKLRTSDTANGTFIDFLELIPSSSATATQYKGFVVDLHGAKKYIKVTGAKCATAVFGDCDYDVKEITIKTGSVPVTASSLSVEVNGTYTAPSGTAYSPVTVAVGLKAFGDATGVVYLTEIPEEDGEVDVYVPAVTGLAKVDGTYAEATGVTVNATAYARYTTGDLTF